MYKKFDRIAANASGVLLLAIMVLTLLDVLGRNLFRHPVEGASELTEIMLCMVIFLMLPHVALRGQHIAIDLIESVVGPRILRALDVLSALLGSAMFFLIAWQAWVQGRKALAYGDFTPSLNIPLGPILFVLSSLAAITALAFLRQLLPTSTAEREPVDEHEPVVL